MKSEKRFIKTEEAIKQAVTKLINLEGLDKFTVRQVTAYAGINRTTFYRHYMDKPDLIEKYRERILDNFQKFINQGLNETLNFQDPFSEMKPYSMFVKIIKMIADDEDFYRAWLGEKGDLKTRAQLIKLFHTNYKIRLEQLTEKRQKQAIIPMEFASELIVRQLWSILSIWLHQKDPMPAEEIIDITMKTRFISPYELAGLTRERGEE